MASEVRKKIVFEDGSEYSGYGFGADCERVCEIVFNTAMAGYQEMMSDLSFTNKIVVMTYPLIGNYGVADEDFEAKASTLGGLVVREYNDIPSNFRYTKTLSEEMEENHIPGIWGVDTREITRKIRDNGSQRVILTNADVPTEKAIEIIKNTPVETNAVEKVSCKKRWYSRTTNAKYNVVAIDCGVKLNIIRLLNARGCNVTVVPFNTSAKEIIKMNPDGVVISNGPGSPLDVASIVDVVKELKGKFPLFGIGLGNLLIGAAYGAKAEKLKFGHHGGNHPVMNVETGKVITVSQSEDYTLNEASLNSTELKITHRDILDKSVAGVENEKDKVFGVQFNPEGAPGAVNEALFDKFVTIMKEGK
ncbi:MAG: glutamine-hydrolyzing carbamoyl-phosphate synthase small subunit [Ruminococcaceae bacterium]|nr:glutamine-hydrolyzing carbamoyl-phosphate synthase small subunit [Oscillospiraceae bacterium]